ncbi:biotin-dependent carboxyltransferase family protein [Acuticoccus kandeliae]|uniref:5-oxoprolinase subunit C family protein n=1 Tax=Acuticoccus kandeliae TaxID=2073160 RepID=UPI000D3E1B17|nr:biotin-dependent carboxyltransferase family protein [Acuticoccus kandeliae]
MLTVLSAAPLATVQDLGRFGHYRHGVGRAGAMDGLALSLGNALLLNPPEAAAIEVPLPPFRLRVETDLDIAVTGADCAAMLDGTALPPAWAVRARAGQELSLNAPVAGGYAYVSVAGGIDVPAVLGARATQLREGFGGYEGRVLARGDRLAALGDDTALPDGGLGAFPPARALPLDAAGAVALRVLPGAEFENFTAESVAALWEAEWRVTRESNRTGYRLAGPGLALEAPLELRSHGVVPGVIQVPHGGQPIIQLADAATMGGYPKIGTVIEADLWRIAQARPGTMLRFVRTSYAEAVAAMRVRDAFVDAVRAAARRHRQAWAAWQS